MGLVKFLRRKLRRQTAAAAAVDNSVIVDGSATTTSAHGGLQLSWKEIQRLTNDFTTVIGYGGFSTVYLAQFRRPSSAAAAAVKVYCSSQRLYQVFKQELQILLHLRHPNIVKLLGFCDDDREEGALILEYIPNGSLQEKLHASDTLLTWNQRTAIAFQLAEAIAYLHESCTPHIVHADIKPSNILLDDYLNCKLCDFGSAKLGFSSAVVPTDSNPNASRKQRMMITGSPGYADPLYLRTGLVSKKNDVYSFGVVVLELITGIEAFSPATGDRLAARAAPLLREAAAEMVDPRIRGEVDFEQVRAMAALAAKCISESPGIRPSASDILMTMRREISCLPFMFEEKNSRCELLSSLEKKKPL